MKNQKKKENGIGDKVTIETTTAPDVPGADISKASTQDTRFTESNSPYSLINCKFTPYSITMKNQKNKESKIGDKDTFYAPPTSDVPNTDTPNSSTKDYVSTNSHLPYSLQNCNQYNKIFSNTKKRPLTLMPQC